MTSHYPRTAEEFLALPRGSILDPAVVYFMHEDLVVQCIDQHGQGWQIAQRPDGAWFRRPA